MRGPGELVGELSALAGADETRAASVVALDDVVVQAIPSADFLRFLDQNRDVSFGLLRQLAARLREATSRHADAAGYDVLHRVARALVDEADRHGHAVEGGTAVGAGLSQDDLAGLVAAAEVCRPLARRAPLSGSRLDQPALDRDQRPRWFTSVRRVSPTTPA